MRISRIETALAAFLVLCGVGFGSRALGQAPTPAAKDQLGDALPPGALWRLGSDRFTHRGTVDCIAFSPDGKTLASGGGYHDATLRLWNPTTGKEMLQIKDGGVVRDLVWSADGKLLLTASDGDGVRFWDPITGKLVRQFPMDAASPVHLALSGDGKTLAVGETDFTGSHEREHCLRLRDAITGKELHRFEVERAYNVAFSPDGQVIALGGEPKKIRSWEVSTGKELPALEGHKGGTYAVAFSPNGKLLASGGTYGEPFTFLWEWPSRRLLHRLDTHEHCVYAIRFSPDGKTVATGSGSSNGIIQLWDVNTGTEICQLKGHHSTVHGISFSPDGKKIASIGIGDRTIRLWNVADATQYRPFTRHQGKVYAVAFSPDSRVVATAGADHTVVFWKTSTGEKVSDLLGHQEHVNAIAFAPDGQQMASGSFDKTIRVWTAATGKEIRQIPGPHDAITCLAFSPDGRTLVSGEYTGGTIGMRMPDSAVRLWNVATGKNIHEFQAKTGRVDTVAFSPDGRILASAGPDKAMVHLWDPSTGKRLGKLETDLEPATPRSMEEGITHIVFSPDGRTLASVSEYGFLDFMWAYDEKSRQVRMVRLWEMVTGKERFQIKVPFKGMGKNHAGSRNEITCAAFSADSQTLILGKVDGAVSVWDLPTAKETCVVPAHKDKVAAIALSPDGKTFATGSWDTTALLWDETNVRRHQRAKPKGLTVQEREALWTDLASEDSSRAYRAIWAMVGEPGDCLSLVNERLKPVPKVAAGRLAQLIQSLDDDKFAVREQAMTELNMLGEMALPALRKALTGQVSAEVKRRIEKLLEKLGGPVPPPEVLRTLRAIEVLEHIDSLNARQVLHAVSQGAPEARLTQDAKASLERLAKRAPASP